MTHRTSRGIDSPAARHLRWMLATLAALSVASAAVAEEGSYALDFLSMGLGARAVAMGGAYVAVAEDATAGYWNPAGLVQIPSRAFASQRADAFQSGTDSLFSRGLAQYTSVSGVFPFEGGAKVAVTWIRMGVDDIPRTTFEDVNGDGVLGTYRDTNLNGKKDPGELYVDTPVVADAFSNADDAGLVSYARAISPKLSVGGTVKIVRQSLYVHTGSGFGVDAGALYTAHPRVRVGLALYDIAGTRVKWNTTTRPTFVREGSARLGASWIVPRLPPSVQTTLAADVGLGTPVRRETDRSSRFHLGAECTLVRTLSLRVGGDAGSLTAGTGIAVPLRGFRLHADYAFLTHPELGDTQRISLSGEF
ncbi:hypothetical protein FJZ36_12955 [Candidatus Poribacteria bacterium]|nr:hypothetical protein [Candidatus Poribacteria bacterium]